MEDLNELVTLVLRPGTFALAVAVVILTFFTKRIVEITLPRWKAGKGVGDGPGEKELIKVRRYTNKMALWWNEVIVYAIPVTYGALIGLMNSEFLHGSANAEVGARVMWGMAIGWFSSFFYKVLRRAILKKTGVDIKPGSIAPPPSGSEE